MNLRKLLILLLSLVLIIPVAPCQTPELNEQKYWFYRERLINAFLVPGTVPGGSLACQTRCKNNNEMDWADAPWQLAWYIGVLATEYKLLKDGGASDNEKTKTLDELVIAIKAINRLDRETERFWRHYHYDGPGSPPPLLPALPSDLNGFMMRDDVPDQVPLNFLSTTFEGQSVQNYLNSNVGPGTTNYSRYPVHHTFSGWEAGIFHDGVGPREMSQEHLGKLFMGLALVVRYINPTDPFINNNSFLIDSEGLGIKKNVVNESKAIVTRIISWLKIYNWIYVNPITNHCALGVCWNQPQDCLCGGAVVVPVSFAFAELANKITTGVFYDGIGPPIGAHDPITLTSRLKLKKLYDDAGSGGGLFSLSETDIYWLLNLAAMSDTWDGPLFLNVTKEKLKISSLKFNYEILPLLHHALYGQGNDIPKKFYWCLFNQAPAEGPGYQRTYEWSGKNRFHDPLNRGQTYECDFNGLDYMLAYNLFMVAYGDEFDKHVDGTFPKTTQLTLGDFIDISSFPPIAQQILSPSLSTELPSLSNDVMAILNLAEIQIPSITSTTIGNDANPLNVKAFNEITAHCVVNSDGNVTLRAQKIVKLQKGFHAKSGSYFHAYTAPFQCGENFRIANPDGALEEINAYVIDDQIENESAQFSSVEIYPNPNNGQFTIEFTSDQSESAKIVVWDMMGKAVYEKNTLGQKNIINLSSHPKGIYFVKVIAGDQVFTEKIIYQ